MSHLLTPGDAARRSVDGRYATETGPNPADGIAIDVSSAASRLAAVADAATALLVPDEAKGANGAVHNSSASDHTELRQVGCACRVIRTQRTTRLASRSLTRHAHEAPALHAHAHEKLTTRHPRFAPSAVQLQLAREAAVLAHNRPLYDVLGAASPGPQTFARLGALLAVCAEAAADDPAFTTHASPAQPALFALAASGGAKFALQFGGQVGRHRDERCGTMQRFHTWAACPRPPHADAAAKRLADPARRPPRAPVRCHATCRATRTGRS
jgi:hypothetical protein